MQYRKLSRIFLTSLLAAQTFMTALPTVTFAEDEAEQTGEVEHTEEITQETEQAQEVEQAESHEEDQPLPSGYTKTPNLSKEVITDVESDVFQMPSDFPEDLATLPLDTRSHIVVDTETGKVLLERDANTPYPIASMTKVLAMYLIYEAIDNGELSLDQKITPNDEIVETITQDPELSNVGLESGVAYPVEDLMHAIMIASANDATSAVMWEIYGSEQEASKAMQEKLDEWGLNGQIFSVSGAPNENLPESMWLEGSTAEDQNTLSARDVALMSYYTVRDYPQILDITKKDEYTFMKDTDYEEVLPTNNLLLEGYEFGRPGVTGLKSGYTDAAGKNFVATSNEDSHPIIAVAMGVFGEELSTYEEIATMLNGIERNPEVYDMDLPVFWKKTQAELEEEKQQEAEKIIEEEITNGEPMENNRDSGLTNFMRRIFNFF